MRRIPQAYTGQMGSNGLPNSDLTAACRFVIRHVRIDAPFRSADMQREP